MAPKSKKRRVDLLPHCTSLGITESQIRGNVLPIFPDLTNGAVIDVYRFCKVNKLDLSVVSEWCKKCIDQPCDIAVGVLFATQAEMRHKKQYEALQTLESTAFSQWLSTFAADPESQESPTVMPPSSSSDMPCASSTPSNYMHVSSNPVDQRSVRTDDVKLNNAMETEILSKERHIRTLTNKIEDLKAEKEAFLRNIKMLEGKYSKYNVDRRDRRGEENYRKVMKLTPMLKKTLHSCEQKDIEIKRLKIRLQQEKTKKSAGEKKAKHELGEKRKEVKVLKENVAILASQLDAKSEPSERKDGGRFSEEMRMCVIELLGLEVATAKVGPVIQTVARYLFSTELSNKDVPSRETCRKIADEGHYLSKCLIKEKLQECDHFGVLKDGTTRKRKKIQTKSVVTNDGHVMPLGYSLVASETGQAIADDCQDKLKEVAAIDGGPANEVDRFLAETVKKLTFVMNDRAANEKKSNEILTTWRREILEEAGLEDNSEVQTFFCSAHVLLGFHTNAIKALRALQDNTEDGKVGRDCSDTFADYTIDSAVKRVCKIAADTFGPAGDHLGLRDLWEGHCATNGIKSKIGNYRDNRFNALFSTSYQTLHHLQSFQEILRNVKTPNKKLQSLFLDLQDSTIISMLTALAIFHQKITGPLLHLVINNKVKYLHLYKIFQPLHTFLNIVQDNPSHMIVAESPLTPVEPEVHLSHECHEILLQAIKAIASAFLKTMDSQLKDFLEGGQYASEPTSELLEATGFAPISNLTSEHQFGSLDSSQRRRPNCSFHHHSSLELIKRTKLSSWMRSMHSERRKKLWAHAAKLGRALRLNHLKKSRETLEACGSLRLQQETQLRNKNVDTMKSVPAPTLMSLNVGQWVAVAYQDSAYPGIIKEQKSDTTFIVDFAHPCSVSGRFKWPNGKDVQLVHKHFILKDNLSISTGSSGRQMAVETWAEIENLYREFSSCYFERKL